MKKFLLLTILGLSLYGQNNYERAYVKLSGMNKNALQVINKKDEFYKKAKEYLDNPVHMITRKVNVADPETQKGKVIEKEVALPDFENALSNFMKSVNKYNNPISAYSGIFIINNYTNRNNPKRLKDFKILAEALYNQSTKICQSYLYLGEVYEKGYFVKSNTKKALRIYEEGIENERCKTGWISSILASKTINLKKKSNK